MTDFVIEATIREDLGKGASRRLRHQELIPAVVYGANKPAQSLTIAHNKMFHALENEAFYSSIIELKIAGKKQQAILKDLQRHPFKPKILHADFQRVDSDTELHVNVPIHFLGEENSPGVKAGGVLNKLLTDVEVVCLPADLPGHLELDISQLELDAVVHVSELSLPSGVKLSLLEAQEPHDATIVSCSVPKEQVDEEPEVDAGDVEATAEAKPEDKSDESGESKDESAK